MKTTLWVLLFLCTSALFAEVLFYDNFNRTNGAVGNSWTNIGTATTAIENNAMKIVSPNGTGIRHDFTTITSGVFYIQYDWKVVSTGWFADAFPTGVITHLTMDVDGNISYDLDGTMITPIVLQNIGLGAYATIRFKIDLDADNFSIWINDIQVAENVDGNVISSFSSFTFRGLGSSSVQYIDNFVVFNSVAPSGLTASSNVNEITINWTPSLYPEAVSYKIYRDIESQPTASIATVSGTQSQFIDYNAVPSTDYFYRIKAVNAGYVESEYSEEVSVHLQPAVSVTPEEITLFVGTDLTDTTSFDIINNGNYTLNYSLQGNIIEPGLSRSVYFNGVNDHKRVELGDFGNQQVFTIAMWIKPGATQNRYADILDCNHGGEYNWTIQRESNGPEWGWGYTGNTFLLTPNEWQHLAVTADNGLLRIYVNGNLVSEVTRPLFNYDYIPEQILYLGSMVYLSSRCFNGLIDDVHISTVVRYNGNFNPYLIVPPDSNTYGYWTFNEESGSVCYDISDAHNNAQIVGNVLRSSDVPFTNTHTITLSHTSGALIINQQQEIQVTINITQQQEGTLVDTLYVYSDDPANPIIPIIVTIHIDLTPPLAVNGLATDPNTTDANHIGITWTQNALADSVVSYKIFRRGRDEATWRQVGTVPDTQLWFIDNQFTGLDSTYVYYRVRAVDWVGNIGPEGTDLMAALERFLAPENVQIENINDRDIHLTWNPVTHTISGLPGTPTCYVIYKSQYPYPTSDFDFLAISQGEEYTHQWALYFQPLNRLFYIVTAYGGNMSRVNELLATKREWKYGELESKLISRETVEITK